MAAKSWTVVILRLGDDCRNCGTFLPPGQKAIRFGPHVFCPACFYKYTKQKVTRDETTLLKLNEYFPELGVTTVTARV